jgi:hypothetical protein
VAISVLVSNHGNRQSAPTRALIQSATLGAFVPWRTLTVLEVPELGPGESAVLRTEAYRPTPRPLGPPDRLPPARLLTALGAEDDETARDAAGSGRASALRSFLKRQITADPVRGTSGPQAATLPASPFDLLFGKTTYWAGNLNVFLGDQAVERHRAEALRILPGRLNLAMFCVGGGPSDAYRFEINGLEPRWEAFLLDLSQARTFASGLSNSEHIKLGAWVPRNRFGLMILALSPPADCEQAEVEVHVTQQSTGKSAVVEFSFDPRAAGPGCYVVG